MATPAATDEYRRRFGRRFGRTYFRRHRGCSLSSVGIGTYLGEPTETVDEGYREAVVAALEGGANVVDTAINYRHQRSERVVGAALEAAAIDREAAFVATKGGFLPFDGDRPADPAASLRETYLETGLVDPADLARGVHCIAPEFLADQLDRSRENLGLETVDCYYVHNPETQLATRPASSVYDQLERAFERLEERAAVNDLRTYGVATWDALRVPPDHDQHLSLAAVHRRAESAAETVGNEETAFGAIQLPFNATMADAYTVEAHETPGDPSPSGDGAGSVSALEYAREAGLSVFTSASLSQGELAEPGAIPDAVAQRLPGDSPARRAINFARSAPGVVTALVGSNTAAHVTENLGAGEFDAMGAAAFDATVE